MLRTTFAISILIAGCVMPHHRGIATVANGYLFAGGVAMGALVSSDARGPYAWKDLDRAAGDLAAGMMLLALTGELLTVALHRDAPQKNSGTREPLARAREGATPPE